DASASADSSAGGPDASEPDVFASDDAPQSNPDSSMPNPDASSCGNGMIMCTAGCVPSDDIHTCGTCDNDCTQLAHVSQVGLACNAGTCQFNCLNGYAHCSGAGGCETSLNAVNHCGNCSTSCSGNTPVCAGTGVAGGYACSSGCGNGMNLCD